jgi:para-nitrobenzyl esterase
MAGKHVVETASGKVEGTARGAHVRFLGIPYAKPPVGRLRFRAPEAPEPWSGVRSAAHYGSSALQGWAFVPGVVPDGPQSEDCLYLNVYTPSSSGGRKRPVMVWIHGGAFTIGSASQPLYDGGALAEAGDVVVVTLNYRVGALGFLALGEAGRASGRAANVGLLDQLAALEWVQANIAAFGGDARNVTVFGESAGGTSVCAWLVTARAEGLFARAIAESPSAPLELASEQQADRTTQVFLAALGLSSERLDELDRVPVEALVRAQREVEKDNELWHFYPVFDPALWAERPATLLASGEGARVPLVIGFNRDEWNLFEIMNAAEWSKPLDVSAALQRLERRLVPGAAGRAAELLEAYRASRTALGLPHDNRALVRAIEGDQRFGIPTLRFAELYAARGVPTFVYRFTYSSPALRGALGACHALELPFVFGNLSAPDQDRFAGTGAAVELLGQRMQRAWLACAERGDPNHAGLPAWPIYDEHRPTLIFDTECELAMAPFDAERRAWDGVF